MASRRFSPSTIPLIVASIWAVAFFVYLWIAKRFGGALPTCSMKRFFDIPCPTCRGTRAGLALWRGEILEAFWWNPLVAVLLIVTPITAIAAWFGAFKTFRPTGRFWKWLAATLVVVVLVNWYYVLKMGG